MEHNPLYNYVSNVCHSRFVKRRFIFRFTTWYNQPHARKVLNSPQTYYLTKRGGEELFHQLLTILLRYCDIFILFGRNIEIVWVFETALHCSTLVKGHGFENSLQSTFHLTIILTTSVVEWLVHQFCRSRDRTSVGSIKKKLTFMYWLRSGYLLYRHCF